ncbi:hypothetical protein TH606_05295 [Thermodesulfatator autotrophicus]|uniref:TonB-dependent receptor plug domain-containing protein n=1 Tax=Thermodesulfatator autotrophicus TaxID=1795632 RepID=A0A177E8E8_9BACT|nr:hypothetical protein TH606_05295 [Thermodesulfatator autotrophicus]
MNQVSGVKASASSVSLWGSSKVKVFLDGRSINDPTSRHGAVKWDLVPLKNVVQIKICKGTGSAEFGDDTSGGVIIISTKKISSLYGYVEGYLGNLDTKSTEAYLEKRLITSGFLSQGTTTRLTATLPRQEPG